ncbi:H-NS histone family protein [Paraburkholderia kururiensis]|uniref:H-NS histone family protein n=1 Tax=Paraburkholderia kururiensis TaxID=984307 RepID=UPI0009DF20B3|nr:H-NS family nucleoid-associated regulatory protein [Paraburkholderia kururiensis]
MATLESIQARIARLQAQAQELVAKQSTVILDKIRELMTKHGITTADIEAHAGKRRGRKPGKQATTSKHAAGTAKYRDPKTGATWTGHGRAPAWIAAAKDRNKFLIPSSPVKATPVGKKAAKGGNYVRGPQPAMYQDSKTGATWSGRGRAPAWIADAKDRTKFLITGEQKEATASSNAPTKKAPAKKVGAKRAVAKAGGGEKAPAKKTTAGRVVSRKSTPRKGAGRKTVASKPAATATETAPASVDASASANG